MPQDGRPKRGDAHNWDHHLNDERYSDGEYDRERSTERGESSERDREYHEKPHRSRIEERGHRDIQRGREHHVLQDLDGAGHHDMERDPSRRRVPHTDIERSTHGERNADAQRSLDRRRGVSDPLETEYRVQHETDKADRSRDHFGESGTRRQRHLSHEKATHEVKDESALLTAHPKNPPVPVPLDLPGGRSHPEYGPRPYQEDPRLKAELFPLEDNIHVNHSKEKLYERLGHDEERGGSNLNIVSAETFGHLARSRQGEAHHYQTPHSRENSTHETSGVRKLSSRNVPFEIQKGSRLQEGVYPKGAHLQEKARPTGSPLEEGIQPMGSYLQEGTRSIGSHLQEGVYPRDSHSVGGVYLMGSHLPEGGHRKGSHIPEGAYLDKRTQDYVKTDGTRRTGSVRRRSVGDSRLSAKKLHSYSILKEEEDTVKRNASVLLPVLEDTEKIFHELVASGDVSPIRVFLEDHPDFNINCVNYHKISALHVAVKQQNEAMVEFLLEQRGMDISDCALYAIKGGNVKIVEMILDKIREKSPGLEYAGTTHSVDFPDDLTPLILAAQLGNYEMIDFLIKRDHSIPPVHPPFCKCEACKADLKKYDRLRYSTMKLNLYKAICNPMYIFHTTDDPFQRAFELTKELQDAATVFPQFKVSFEELWKNLRAFTVDLVGCCRNAQEVEIILKKSPTSVADHVKFPRLQYAIDLKQKEFVSHPYTQAVLGDAWTGELLEWKIRSPMMQFLSVFPRIPMLPIMTIMCIVLPTHSLVRKWRTPVNKMISSVASYLIFLIILFLESNLDKSNQKRGPPNSGLEGVIIIYVVGYIWLNIRTCFKQGVKRFFSTMWHWYDTIMLFLFSMTIIFWIASWVDITANNDVDLPRKYWNSMDPELIAEGFFAAAVIMAFFRLNLFLSLNYHLGPLQVSIGKMTLDIFRFIIIFSVIILAWCAGLCRFYQPYAGMVQKDAASGNTTTQVPSFISFLMTLKTFFWAIFGMSPIESADVIIENLPGDTPGTTIINKHDFTEAVGYIAFALFQFLSVVVVLNMLVACMANTFTKVIDNVTVEWVFGRSQIYLSFMASSTLPPPFNLIPTASSIKDMFRWFKLLAKPSDGQRARCSLAHCCYIESETEAYVNSEFPSLMSDLAQRYIRLKEEGEEEESNDIDEIRNDINEIKELLRKVNAACIYRRTSF